MGAAWERHVMCESAFKVTGWGHALKRDVVKHLLFVYNISALDSCVTLRLTAPEETLTLLFSD
jgi:hypothetical protein